MAIWTMDWVLPATVTDPTPAGAAQGTAQKRAKLTAMNHAEHSRFFIRPVSLVVPVSYLGIMLMSSRTRGHGCGIRSEAGHGDVYFLPGPSWSVADTAHNHERPYTECPWPNRGSRTRNLTAYLVSHGFQHAPESLQRLFDHVIRIGHAGVEPSARDGDDA